MGCECFGMHLPDVTMFQTGAWLTYPYDNHQGSHG